MTRPASSNRPTADAVTVMPTQRIVHSEVSARVPDAHPGTEPATSGAPVDPSDLDLGTVATGLPNLSAVLAGVPGGLGAEVGESFTYAGQRWTAADAKVSGTPIGLQLAMEQRGLDTSDGIFEMPLQRSGL